jgi:hypothetical protein
MSTTSGDQHDNEALPALSSVDLKKPLGDDAVSSVSSNLTGCKEMDIIALSQELDDPMVQLSRMNDCDFMYIFDFDNNTE